MMAERFSDGCLRMTGRSLSRDDIDALKAEARLSPLKRARICVHGSEKDPVQEMFVLLLKDSPKGTYKYQRASSKLLLDGAMTVEFADGESVTMTLDVPFMRVPADVYHTPKILTDYVLLYEVHAGPWTPAFTMHREERIAYERENGLTG